jgi:succinate dehydrogenase/fumarate reductase flavoprotein subunit
MSVQGYHAGAAAAACAATVGEIVLPAETVAALQEKALQPTTVEKGFNPEWIREVLHSIMAPGWMNWGGATEATLNAALTNIIELRDTVQGRIYAQNGHALRLAHEAEHMLLAMELKVRAKLERKESRGHHYRRDYPCRDDNYLYYLTETKGADGEVVFGQVELPERWTGDVSAEYTVRYPAPQNPLDAEINYPKDEK